MFNPKIVYLANIRLPNERGHCIQIMKTCEALKKNGADIELWTSNRDREISDDEIFDFYSIKEKFTLKNIPALKFLPSWRKSGFYLRSFSFFFSVCLFLLMKKRNIIVYTRDEILLFLTFFTRKMVFWESHMAFRSRFLLKNRIKRLGGVVVITENLRKILVEKFNTPRKKIAVAHDAVDLNEYSKIIDKKEAREKLKIPQNKQVALYFGTIFKQKGAFLLIDTAEQMPDVYFVLAGSIAGDNLEEAKELVKKRGLKNIILTGSVRHKEQPSYLASADVLILPNSNLDERTRDFTSPLKLFEYMSSRRPIVASATLTIKEVLRDKENAILVEPDSARTLMKGIKSVLENKNLSQKIAEQALIDVREYTWDKRSERILNLIKR